MTAEQPQRTQPQEQGQDALQPVHELFNEVVVKDRERIDREFTRVKSNVNGLMRLTLDRQLFDPEVKPQFVRLLVRTGDAVGDCLRLAAKYKYPVEQSIQPPPSRLDQRNETSPVVIQNNPTPQEAGRVHSFWSGIWEYMIARLQHRPVEEQPKPLATTPTVIDEVRALSEVRPVLNDFTDTYYRCLRRDERHPNPAIKRYLHWRAEQDLTKIGLILIGASKWAARAETDEARQTGVALAGYAARVAEAEAMRPIFPSGGTMVIPESQWRPGGIDLDEEWKKRRGG